MPNVTPFEIRPCSLKTPVQQQGGQDRKCSGSTSIGRSPRNYILVASRAPRLESGYLHGLFEAKGMSARTKHSASAKQLCIEQTNDQGEQIWMFSRKLV